MAIPKNPFGGPLQSPGDRNFIAKLREHIRPNLANEQLELDSLARTIVTSQTSPHRNCTNF
jgi:hypothetical protein